RRHRLSPNRTRAGQDCRRIGVDFAQVPFRSLKWRACMAGKGGGGAWKVAYADFVTAMMAFFLVMWLCAQNSEVKKSVAEYFPDPLGTTAGGPDKKATRTGAVTDAFSSGNVPLQM